MIEQPSGLTLGRLSQILRRSWQIVVAVAVVGAGVALLVSAAQTPLYQANSSVYFSLTQGATSSDLNQGSAYTQAQMLSFAQLAKSSITLNRVIDDLTLDTTPKLLARDVTVNIPQNTVILEITASSPSAKQSAQIADSVARKLAGVVVELAPSVKGAAPAVSARVIQPAVIPEFQSSPSKLKDTLLGGILGLLLGMVGCVLFALLDTRVRSVEALASISQIPPLGQIARAQPSPDSRPVMVRNPNGEEAESFRRVRAGLRFASVDKDVRVMLVTSALPSEGKTTLAVNLAIATAETGARVLLVDADFRRPRVAERLDAEGSIGLTSVLVGAVSLDEARRPFGTTSLDLLLAGDIPPNPSELLSSAKMAQVLAELSTQYDLVILDTAPVLSVADATLLAPHVDLSLMVVDSSKLRKAQLVKAIHALEGAGVHISGIVLNRVRVAKRTDDYYYGVIPDKNESSLAKTIGKIKNVKGAQVSGTAPSADVSVSTKEVHDAPQASASAISTEVGTGATEKAVSPTRPSAPVISSQPSDAKTDSNSTELILAAPRTPPRRAPRKRAPDSAPRTPTTGTSANRKPSAEGMQNRKSPGQ